MFTHVSFFAFVRAESARAMSLILAWFRALRVAMERRPRTAAAGLLLVLAVFSARAGTVSVVRRKVVREAALRHVVISVGGATSLAATIALR